MNAKLDLNGLEDPERGWRWERFVWTLIGLLLLAGLLAGLGPGSKKMVAGVGLIERSGR